MSVIRYGLNEYHADLDAEGLASTWDGILSHFSREDDSFGVFSMESFGYLYEDALAYLDKRHKKELGQYFTPQDVASLMSEWLRPLKGKNVCGVCCGTGNLIVSYLKTAGRDEAEALLKEGRVWLYDTDPVALNICRKSIEIVWGVSVPDDRCTTSDFLDASVRLPDDSKVISNPPYFKITDIPPSWERTKVLNETMEFYSVITEKILRESVASVIITPYSFMGGRKFYPLRSLMNDHSGFIVSFDNVPSNIFCGRKHGSFNTNTANSVRAAITVTDNADGARGYRMSGLVRFKAGERAKVVNRKYLESVTGTAYQVVDEKNPRYAKCLPALEDIMRAWFDVADSKLRDLTSRDGDCVIHVPNTCRYFTVATKRDLKRVGKIELRFKDEMTCAYAYCMINSSFCYWYWRLYDGGITYSADLLYSLPCFYGKVPEGVKKRCVELYYEMTAIESENLVYKKNAGAMQENVRFPDRYRDEIDDIFLKALNRREDSSVFASVHSGRAGM